MGRYEWALEECAELGDIARYRVDERRAYLRIPGATRMNRRELGILNEIVKLRDRIARERDLPLKYVLPDDVVGGLATLRPKRVDDLAQLRRLDAGARRQLGPRDLGGGRARRSARRRATFRNAEAARSGASRDTLASLLGVVVGEIAREADLPPNLLVPRAALERVARELPRDRERFDEGARAASVAARSRGRSAVAAVLGRSRPRRSKATRTATRRYDFPMTAHANSFNAIDTLRVGDRDYTYFRLDALERAGVAKLARLPYSLKILLENLLRFEDGRSVTAGRHRSARALERRRRGTRRRSRSVRRACCCKISPAFRASSILAAMRDAMAEMGGDPKAINPLQPVELVIDHSVQVDYFGSDAALEKNADLEFERNHERYAFLKWGQSALHGFRAVPPDTGIVHQVNIEYLARVVFGAADASEQPMAYPDTAVGTDSHTTMVNGLGVLAWGVGGIEAEAAMLGQPVTMLIPEVDRRPAGRRAARRRHRDRPRADDHGNAAQARRRRQVRRVFRAAVCRRCRSPTARRSATCRRSSVRPSRFSRSTTGRSSICA